MRPSLRAALLCLALCTACGGPLSGLEPLGVDPLAAPSADAGFRTAAHAPLPHVGTMGGPVLSHPVIQPIGYPTDTTRTQIDAFLQELTHTAFWANTTGEYGVGPLTVLPTVLRADTAPANVTDSAIQSQLQMNLSGANPAWGPADSGTIYLMLLPVGTIEQDPSGKCCTDFDGYHGDISVSGTQIAYAVTCSCPGFDGPSITDVQQRTVVIAHELVESATDPFGANPAWTQLDNNDAVWAVVTGGELADMCEYNNDAYYVPPDATFMIQRTWSNTAADAGQNPCVPAPNPEPFFDSLPALSAVTWAGTPTMGIQVPLGQSKTVPLDLFSAGPMPGPWHVTAYDYNTYVLGAATANLGLTLDKATGQNGDAIQLTIQANTANTSLGSAEAFILVSEYGTAGTPQYQSNLAMAVVTN